MHQAGAVLGGDIVGQHHEIGRAGELDQFEGPPVLPAFHLGPGTAFDDLPGRLPGVWIRVAQHHGEQRFGHHHPVGTPTGQYIIDLGMHRDRGIGDQGPRRGRPYQQVGARPGPAGQRETHIDRGVGNILIALGDLVIGQGGLIAGTVGGDPMILDEQALVEDLLQRPPFRFDVGGIHRPIGLLQIDPIAHPAGQLGELADMARYRGPAEPVELGDSHGLDLALVIDAQFLLDRQFDGQPMAIPAGLAVDPAALHRLETGEYVLEDPCLDVVGAGMPVRGRWALEECPGFAGRAGLPAALEGLVAIPQLQDLVVHRR